MITNIFVKDFRSFKSLNLDIHKNLVIFKGCNACGKTTILEAINYASITKSHRSHKISELIRFKQDFSIIKIKADNNEYEVILTNKGKKVKINQIEYKKISEYIASLQVVFFSPNDLELVTSHPKARRDFLDMEASKISKNYLYILKNYEQILNERNLLLKNYNENKFILLKVITSNLIEYAKKIYEYRKKIIDKLNQYLIDLAKIFHEKEELRLHYIPNIKDNYKENYQKYLTKDIMYKTTCLGPHRDDFQFLLNEMDAKKFASQGQIRSIILALKISVVMIMNLDKKKTPILLLDDVLSELDINRQNNLLNMLKTNIQTFITTTDLNKIDETILTSGQIVDVEAFTIKKEKYYE